MKRLALVVVVGAVATVLVRRRGDAPSADSRTEAVLRDVAARGLDQRWNMTTGDALAMSARQDREASVIVEHGSATILMPDWVARVRLDQVHEVVCERQFIHWPEPGYVTLDLVFTRGPDDEDGYLDPLFDVTFSETHEAEFLRLCERHRLRCVGDCAR